jgi:hypothetical protein
MNVAETLHLLNYSFNTMLFTLRVRQVDMREGAAALVGRPVIRWEAAVVVNTELFDTNPDADFDSYEERNLIVAYSESMSEAVHGLDRMLSGAAGVINMLAIRAAIKRIRAGG